MEVPKHNNLALQGNFFGYRENVMSFAHETNRYANAGMCLCCKEISARAGTAGLLVAKEGSCLLAILALVHVGSVLVAPVCMRGYCLVRPASTALRTTAVHGPSAATAR